VRILDPSCGSGYFLIKIYEMLRCEFVKRLDAINRHNHLNLEPANIHEHIIRHNLYGCDIDCYAVKLAVLNIMSKEISCREVPRIIECDSLTSCELPFKLGCSEQGFDIIIGNPPYVGHKKMSTSYRKKLQGLYGDVFKDKADLSFCFIKNSLDRLHENGLLCFITSRYLMESPSAELLRKYLKGNCSIERIVDFYGVRIMKGISVDPAILFIKKGNCSKESAVEVIRAKEALKDMASRVNVPDLTTFINSIVQADQFGVSIGSVLRIQSEQVREKRRQRAREKALKAPVKMLVPMVFFIFPTIFSVLMGPIVLKLISIFSKTGL
jgi:adenine-specific DNA-methyltransferase